MAIYSGLIYPLKIVIFHSYVKLPEGTGKNVKKKYRWLGKYGSSDPYKTTVCFNVSIIILSPDFVEGQMLVRMPIVMMIKANKNNGKPFIFVWRIVIKTMVS